MLRLIREKTPPHLPPCLHDWKGHYDCDFCPGDYHIYCDRCDTNACGNLTTSAEDALERANKVIARQTRVRRHRFNPN